MRRAAFCVTSDTARIAMSPFSTIHVKRNTAFMALLIWLFALASGIANACLLEAPQAHVHARSEHASNEVDRVGPASEVTKLQSVEHHHHENDDVSKDACVKTCDSGSNTPTKVKSSFDSTNQGTAFLVTTAQPFITPGRSTRRRLDDTRRPVEGPPLRVRYSRLAL
jgi:hypothetical protein